MRFSLGAPKKSEIKKLIVWTLGNKPGFNCWNSVIEARIIDSNQPGGPGGFFVLHNHWPHARCVLHDKKNWPEEVGKSVSLPPSIPCHTHTLIAHIPLPQIYIYTKKNISSESFLSKVISKALIFKKLIQKSSDSTFRELFGLLSCRRKGTLLTKEKKRTKAHILYTTDSVMPERAVIKSMDRWVRSRSVTCCICDLTHIT